MRTFKTIAVTASVAAVLLSAGVAFAREGGASTTANNQNREQHMLISTSTQSRLQTIRDEMQTRLQAQYQKVTLRISDILDKAKQQMAKRLATQFVDLNKTWTDKFAKQLDQYDAVLLKIQTRADIAAGNGKDVASTTAAIQSAKTAIATARTAVIAQAAKVYAVDPSTIPTVATSTSVGQQKIMKSFQSSFQTLHTTLFKDLFALRDGVITDARKAVHNALQTLSKIPGVDDKGNKNATTTATTTNP